VRILLATDAFPPKIDGVADTSEILARMLGVRGHDVTVLATGRDTPPTGAYTVRRMSSLPFPLYPELRISTSLLVLRRVVREPWDAAIIMTPGPIGIRTLRLLPHRVPVINVYTTDVPQYLSYYRLGALRPLAWRLLRWMARRSRATLCPTEHVRAGLAARGFPRLHVWGRGVDTALFHPSRRSAAMRDRLSGGDPGKPLVLYVGRLAKEKSVGDLAAALRRLEGVRGAIVGDGPERGAIEQAFTGLPAVFTGYLRGETLAEAYASADVFAFPSPSETFGQVVLQAMASGLPAVVVEGTAPAELVPAGVAGLHVPAHDPAAMATALARVLGEPGLRDAMAAAAFAHAAGYSWERLVDRLEGLLAGAPVEALATVGRG
jgi:glycosyltransferase involved in cell wall biosynthesis